MKTKIELITPEIARQLLVNNKMNRAINTTRVNEYARLMSAGLWKEETGESIKIDEDNNVLDGQHRLLAIIKSGIQLNFLIVSGLETNVFNVIDTGTSRTAADIFHIAGVMQPNNYASIITRYIGLSTGHMAVLRQDTKTGGGLALKTMKISKAELLSIYNHKIKFWKAVVSMTQHWNALFQRTLSISELGALYAYFYDIDTDDAFKFMESLCTGVSLESDDPIRLLREKLIFSKMNSKLKIPSVQKLGLIYKTWNLFRKNQKVKILRYNRETEDFPVPV
jgi:hypothetical protein